MVFRLASPVVGVLLLVGSAISAEGFTLVPAPPVSIRQLSTNPQAYTSMVGYGQISEDGSTVYFVDSGGPLGEQLLRWRAGQPNTLITNLENQVAESTVSRPTTNANGTIVAFRSRFAPDGTTVSPARLYVYQEGVGIHEVYGSSGFEPIDPMLKPDGSGIVFSSTENIGGANPRNELTGYQYNFASQTVTPMVTFPQAAAGSKPNGVVWRGVANGSRDLFYSNANFDGTNPSNNVEWYLWDNGQQKSLRSLTNQSNIGALDASLNLTSYLSADGGTAITTSPGDNLGGVKTWVENLNAGTSQEIDLVPQFQSVVALSGNGRYLFFADRQSPLAVYRIDLQTDDYSQILAPSGSLIDWKLSVDMSGNNVVFMSDNNLTGQNPNDRLQTFLVTIPEPATGAVLACASLALLRRRGLGSGRFQPCTIE